MRMLIHETNSCVFNITESDLSFETIYKKKYFPKEISEVKSANVLLIPDENLRENLGITFPETTLEFFEYLKENSDDNFVPDIAVTDEDFKKFNMHSDLVYLASVVCTAVVLPIVINLVSSFLYDLANKFLKKEEELSADINIYVQDDKNGKSLKFHYKGPVKGIKKVLNEGALKSFKDMYVENDDGIDLKKKKRKLLNNGKN